MSKKHPAIALLEFRDISVGMHTTDALVKKSPIASLKCGTISPGRYLTFIAGTTASVDEAYQEGLFFGKDSLIDHAIFHDVHDTLHDAFFGEALTCDDQAMLILETGTVASNAMATERALKGVPITLCEFRFADELLHGKGVSIFSGELADIEAAAEIVTEFLHIRGTTSTHRIITQPHAALLDQANKSTIFHDVELSTVEGEDKVVL